MRTWIFQGNPDNFKVDAYLADCFNKEKAISWSIRQEQYIDSIKINDIVYIWRSLGKNSGKGSSGIIARTLVTEEAILRPDDTDSQKYWKNKDGAIEVVHRVRLKILETKISGGYILRERLIESPFLNDLGVLRIKNNTNYEVLDKHVDLINDIWVQQVKKINDLPFPTPSSRVREYKKCPEELRSLIVYQNLFFGLTHRELDKEILDLDPKESKGYQSMGVLHYLGLREGYRNIFRDYSIEEAVEIIRLEQKENPEVSSLFQTIIDVLIKGNTLVVESSNNNGIPTSSVNSASEDEDEREYPEGRIKYRLHRKRERNPKLIKDAKRLFISKHGGLFCEACNFDFQKTYGDRGVDFIEGHHKKLISEMREGEKTKVEDIAMLCSNCHRMIHRKPLINVEDLKEVLHEMRKR